MAERREKRAAHQAARATRKAEREERQATRAAERSERSATRADSTATPPPTETPAKGSEGTTPEPEPTPPVVAHHRCTISGEAGAQLLITGEAVTLTGKLTCPTTAEASEQTVTIYQREAAAGSPAFAVAGVATTDAGGSYEFHSAALKRRSTFIVRSATTAHGARVVVPVGTGLSLAGPAASGAALAMSAGKNAGGRARAVFSGVIQPEEAGRQIGLRVRYGDGEWRLVAYARTDAEGRFSFSHTFRFAGQVSVMAGARARGTTHAQSLPLTYSIVQAQNPSLTIQSSQLALATPAAPTTLDAVPLGEPAATTISGVASGAPHQTVTLLSRANGHLTAVATVQSDEAGAYSFTVEPAQTTIYEVECGKLRSTTVRVEVK
jgi:hypothetical protein